MAKAVEAMNDAIAVPLFAAQAVASVLAAVRTGGSFAVRKGTHRVIIAIAESTVSH